VLHRGFFHSTGAFRAGPPIAEFQELIGRFAVATDLGTLGELTTDIDRFVYDQALSVFLCAPQALYAVNRHVAFGGYAATFELAETEASSSTGRDGRHFAPPTVWPRGCGAASAGRCDRHRLRRRHDGMAANVRCCGTGRKEPGRSGRRRFAALVGQLADLRLLVAAAPGERLQEGQLHAYQLGALPPLGRCSARRCPSIRSCFGTTPWRSRPAPGPSW
jgi:hypothetical protein